MIRKETRNQRKKYVPELAERLYPLYMNGEIEELGNVATEIIDLQKGHVQALTFKGIYLREINRNKTALKFLQHAVELNSKDKFALVHLSAVQNVFKKHKDSLKTLTQALDLDPEDPQIINLKGETLLTVSRSKEAMNYFLNALKFEPENLTYLANLTKNYRHLGNYSSAIQTSNKILMIEPTNINALLEKVWNLTLDKQYQEAAKVFLKIEKFDRNNIKLHLLKSFYFEKLDEKEESVYHMQKAEKVEPNNLYIIARLARILYEAKMEEECIAKFEQLKTRLEEDDYDKQNIFRNNKYSDPRIEFLKVTLKKADNFKSDLYVYNPTKSLYHYLQRTEYADFFHSIIYHFEMATDEDYFTSEKQIRSSLKNIEDSLNSRLLNFQKKKNLEYIDPEKFIESYKREMIKLLYIFKDSILFAQKEEFCVARDPRVKELCFVPVFWEENNFEKKLMEFLEWRNFRNYIEIFIEKYTDFFTVKFWFDILDWVDLLKENKNFRQRLKNYQQNKKLCKFKKNKIRERILKFEPDHFLKDLTTDAQIMAFIDLEEMKEILLRSYYPKKHPHKLKLENILHYLDNPEDYKSYKGSVMLRNMENMKKDHEEYKKIMLDEALRLRGVHYSSGIVFTKSSKTDIIEITIDSFLTEPFELKFEGFPVDMKVNYFIPSSNYDLMINLKIKGKTNLFRKVCFKTHELKRGCMNYVDIFEEMLLDRTVTHVEKSGTLGLYVT